MAEPRTLYDTDILIWSEQQAALLRRVAAGERVNSDDLDWLNIAEELEGASRSQRAELRHRVKRLLQHLLKWHFQPDQRSRSWRSMILTQRDEIAALLGAHSAEEAPERLIAAALARQAADNVTAVAVEAAGTEMPGP